MRKQGIGLRGEYRVAALLCHEPYNRSVIRCAYTSPYDCVIDGHRTEIKCAAPRPKPHRDGALIWTFNIHRHGVLNEKETDLYILRLEGVPYSKAAIHMLFKAPLGTPTICVSMRALLNQDFAAAVADFYSLAKGEYGRKEVAA